MSGCTIRDFDSNCDFFVSRNFNRGNFLVEKLQFFFSYFDFETQLLEFNGTEAFVHSKVGKREYNYVYGACVILNKAK